MEIMKMILMNRLCGLCNELLKDHTSKQLVFCFKNFSRDDKIEYR